MADFTSGGVKLVDKALFTDNIIELLIGYQYKSFVLYDSIMKYIENGIDAFPAIIKFYEYNGSIIKNLKKITFGMIYCHSPSICPDEFDFDMLIGDNIRMPYSVSNVTFQFSLSHTVTIGSDKYIKLSSTPK